MTTHKSTAHTIKPGPFELSTETERLVSHIVQPGNNPTVHGYALYEDLAKHYSPNDLELLSFTGELPSDAQSHVYEVTRSFMMAPPPGSAANQAAAITHMLNRDEGATVMVAIQMCANEAKHWAEQQQPVLDWLKNYSSRTAQQFVTNDTESLSAVSALLDAIGDHHSQITGIAENINIDAALTCALHFCGLKHAAHLQTVRCLAGMPAVVAEGLCWQPKQLMTYPTRLPDFHYPDAPSSKSDSRSTS